MKKFSFMIGILFYMSLFSLSAQENMPKLAVFVFRTHTNIETMRQDAMALHDLIETSFSYKNYDILPREQINYLLNTRNIHFSNILNRRNEQILQNNNINYIVYCNIERSNFNDYLLTIRMYDVFAGKYQHRINRQRVSGNTEEKLITINLLVEDFINVISENSITTSMGIMDSKGNTNKHNASDTIVGINFGFNAYSENIDSSTKINMYQSTFGMNFGNYLTNWTSVGSGIMIRIISASIAGESTDAKAYLVLPLNYHIKINWLCLGMGINFAFPFVSKSGVIISLPIDIGFDFMKSGGNGMRLLFRIEPQYLSGSEPQVFLGGVWQMWNWRINK